MLHHTPAQFIRAPLQISYVVNQERGEIACRREAYATAPRSHKIGLRICRKARARGIYSEAAYTETASAVVIIGGRVLRIYSDGTIVPMVGPGYVFGEQRLDPQAQDSLFERAHATSLKNARTMARRRWKDAMRADIVLASGFRKRHDPRRMGAMGGPR